MLTGGGPRLGPEGQTPRLLSWHLHEPEQPLPQPACHTKKQQEACMCTGTVVSKHQLVKQGRMYVQPTYIRLCTCVCTLATKHGHKPITHYTTNASRTLSKPERYRTWSAHSRSDLLICILSSRMLSVTHLVGHTTGSTCGGPGTTDLQPLVQHSHLGS
jgi:hypothetical protein